jgi:hypothetical protein
LVGQVQCEEEGELSLMPSSSGFSRCC